MANSKLLLSDLAISHEWLCVVQYEKLEDMTWKLFGTWCSCYGMRKHIWQKQMAVDGRCKDCHHKTIMSEMHSCQRYYQPQLAFEDPALSDVEHSFFIHEALAELPYEFIKDQVTAGIERFELSPRIIEFLPEMVRKITTEGFGLLYANVQNRRFLPLGDGLLKGNFAEMFPMFLPENHGEKFLGSKLRKPRKEVNDHAVYNARMKAAIKKFEEVLAIEVIFSPRLEITDIIKNLPIGVTLRKQPLNGNN